ncbi:MAG: phosphoenolpyruvate--protein phosphotransferase [Acidobacteriota bacterium]
MRSRTLVGLAVSPGIAIGKTLVVENITQPVLRTPVAPEELDNEVRRMREAARQAAERAGMLAREAHDRVGAEYASIFEAHRLLMEDPTLLSAVEQVIRDKRINAEAALEEVVRDLLHRFESLGDVYLRERRVDLLDVAMELQRALQGKSAPHLGRLRDDTVLIADDVPPSQAIRLSASSVTGFASEAGGATSHTTIIAKSLGIPAVVGVARLLEEARGAPVVIIDGFEGHVVVDPDEALLQVYRLRAAEYQRRQQELLEQAALPARTSDGYEVALLANIDLPAELEAARAGGASGIGLYRSEFLFIQASPRLPDEDEQAAAYEELLRAFPSGPVTIRTFDLGGRKLARQVLGSPEANPVLGLRGVRLCLQKPEFFRTQLRALLRAAGRHPDAGLRIMVPLISHLEEVRTVRVILGRLAAELEAEGHSVPVQVPLGAMVEVPAAALVAEHLCREVDFLSIGTNDLTQYTLAVDRANQAVADLFRSFHPAVLRLIERVVSCGRRCGIPVSLCGEMAADPLAVPVLLGLGVREFSMHPPALPVVRSLVREISHRDARRIAQRALALATAKEVEELLLENLSALFARLKVRVRL